MHDYIVPQQRLRNLGVTFEGVCIKLLTQQPKKFERSTEAVMMLPRVMEPDRSAVQRRFEQRVSSVLMAKDYVAVHLLLLERPSISEREATVPMPRPY